MSFRTGCAAAAVLAAGCLYGAGTASAFTCPGKADIEGRITKYIHTEYWSPSQRATWQVKDVSALTFGPFRTGQISMRAVDYGPLREVCPVRIEYSFVVTRNDGRRETTQMGAGKTHLFYQDDFGDWTFKID